MPLAVSFALTVLTHWTHSDALSPWFTRSPTTSTKSIGWGISAPDVPEATIASRTRPKIAQSALDPGCESLIWAKVKRGAAARAAGSDARSANRTTRARTAARPLARAHAPAPTTAPPRCVAREATPLQPNGDLHPPLR